MPLDVSILSTASLPAVTAAVRAVSRRSPLAVLSCVLLDATGDGLTLYGTDLSAAVETMIPARVNVAGRVAIPAADLLAFVKAAPKGERVSIVAGEPSAGRVPVTLSTVGASVTLDGIDADEYPTITRWDDAAGSFTMPASELARILRAVSFAAATDEARPILCAVSVKWGGGALSFAAADNYRIAAWDAQGVRLSGTVDAVLPIESIALWLRILPRKVDGSVTVSFFPTHNQARIDCDGLTLTTRLIDGTYPNYRQVMPVSFAANASLSAAALAAACKAIPADKRAPVIRATFAAEAVTIEAHGEAHGTRTLAATFDGDPLAIGLNPSYLAEAATAAPDDTIAVGLNSPLSPLTLTTPAVPEWTCVIMPVRLA